MRDGPLPGTYPISGGTAELLGDADRENGWVLSVGGVPQSYVDLSDPTYLDFEYTRLMGDVIDHLAPQSEAIDAVHVGGAACTLPRYVATTRPGSRQVVFESDAELVRLAREQLALDTVPGLDVRIADGRTGLTALADDTADLVIVDAYTAAAMPIELATDEFTREVARVLRSDGLQLVNVSDGSSLTFTRQVVATVSEVFPFVMLLAQQEVLSGRRFGNLVVAASPASLPDVDPGRTDASDDNDDHYSVRAGRLLGDDLGRFRAGARPLRDGERPPVPAPPPQVFGQD
ncbi:spermidine synthase [Actinomadura alba]|uniref:Fused MFS/spermidine synthase n=1 Tax=Actinomadura alba TaxID=406431 RepID=A0ABR7LJ17_9ACTN|nr:fused MFS/spermidine synthase [Actinomadura alba]MBC6464840.1 fused MFS/spermidine synthase [Actinomadura alba]